MENLPKPENAVAAIRVSSVKQGTQGDSPEAQKEQIEQFAKSHNIHIKKFFIFLESASKEEQPVQEAIDYCKSKKNDIQLFIIKSIDRFTRGGSYLYEELKMQLDKNHVKLIDIYGVIGTQMVPKDQFENQRTWIVERVNILERRNTTQGRTSF